MAVDAGSQIVTIIYNAQALSRTVNTRHQSIRECGIYSGGYLAIVDASHCSISPLVCEISDGTYQVKVETQASVNLAVAVATPYVVLRWTYTGSAVNDYMDLLLVASPTTNDIVVGKCSFTGGGALQGFIYTDRTTPSVHELFLKVEETANSELRVRVRAGRVQNGKETIQISDQSIGLFTVPSANSKVYLVYVNRSTGAILIDSTGTEAVSPVAPNYAGKLVLAEVTLASVAVNILQSNIVDVRDFINMFYPIDGTTMQISTSGAAGIKTGVLGQSDVVRESNEIAAGISSALVTGMSINMITTGGKLAIDFDADISSDSGQPITFYIRVDGNSQMTKRFNYGPFGSYTDNYSPIHLGWLEESLITPGFHTIDVYWFKSGGTALMNRGSGSYRTLRVIELPHII